MSSGGFSAIRSLLAPSPDSSGQPMDGAPGQLLASLLSHTSSSALPHSAPQRHSAFHPPRSQQSAATPNSHSHTALRAALSGAFDSSSSNEAAKAPSPSSPRATPPCRKRNLDALVLNLHRRNEGGTSTSEPPTPTAQQPPTFTQLHHAESLRSPSAQSPPESPLAQLLPGPLNGLSDLQKAALLLANQGRLPAGLVAQLGQSHVPQPRPAPQRAPPRPPPKAPKRTNGGKAGCELTRPKLSRHNDAAYYPNIQCVLCSEWVCSRNRYMHIESHLQYRPYKCSLCGYDNRKEIFINLHIKRTHKGDGKVLYSPNEELEHRAWELAEQCLQHTRQVLTGKGPAATASGPPTPKAPDAPAHSPNDDDEVIPASAKVDPGVLEPYRDVYRPKIYNTQRAEKSQLIEESRQLGLVPDFSEVASKEELCGVCGSHILRHHVVLEEHVRSHLPAPSYRCNIDACPLTHHSKNFIARHMKEVHKYRRQPLDLLEEDGGLVERFVALCSAAFAEAFDADALKRVRYRYAGGRRNASAPALRGGGEKASSPSSSGGSSPPEPEGDRRCHLCQAAVAEGFPALLDHILSHVSRASFRCLRCGRSESSQSAAMEHAAAAHPQLPPHQCVQKVLTPDSKQEVETLFKVCFPGLSLGSLLAKC